MESSGQSNVTMTKHRPVLAGENEKKPSPVWGGDTKRLLSHSQLNFCHLGDKNRSYENYLSGLDKVIVKQIIYRKQFALHNMYRLVILFYSVKSAFNCCLCLDPNFFIAPF